MGNVAGRLPELGAALLSTVLVHAKRQKGYSKGYTSKLQKSALNWPDMCRPPTVYFVRLLLSISYRFHLNAVRISQPNHSTYLEAMIELKSTSVYDENYSVISCLFPRLG